VSLPALPSFITPSCSADPHPGNLIRTPDGRLAILDFGLMTQVDDDIKFGMIEAISHLIHRDYEAIVQVSHHHLTFTL
jgi:predicted unusual protein kinase regulating ubiquinone biosynthesis (AarF/ABC1/UbiB family)